MKNFFTILAAINFNQIDPFLDTFSAVFYENVLDLPRNEILKLHATNENMQEK